MVGLSMNNFLLDLHSQNPRVESDLEKATGHSPQAIWKMRLRLTQECPKSCLVVSGTAVQTCALFRVLDPKTLHLPCTTLREALLGGKVELRGCRDVTREHVAGTQAGASLGGVGA